MKTLIFGAAGQLGYELMRQAQALNLDFQGVDLPQTDITKMAQVIDVFADYRPALVINAAAYTNVDGAESEPELATAINKDWGMYHYCGRGIISWYEFAQAIVDICRHYGKATVERVDPIKTADYPTRVQRPPYSALDCSLINKHFGISPKPWQNSLAITVHELLSSSGGLPED